MAIELERRFPSGKIILNANDGWAERDFELVPGDLGEDAVHVFRNGQCHSFALAVHELTDWPLIGVGPVESYDNTPNHVVCQTPNGKLFDIGGVIDPEWAAEKWGDPWLAEEDEAYLDLVDVDADAAREGFNGNYRPADVEAARPFAQAALDAYGEEAL